MKKKDKIKQNVAKSEKVLLTGFYLPIFLAITFGILHCLHVSTLFENDGHFSLLSSLEREMSFRTEMGFYYSFYKSLVEAPTMIDGLFNLIYNNKTEYPQTINTLQRFNLYPEVVLAAFYRTYNWFTSYLKIPSKQCWQVDRGGTLAPVISCEGLGDPTYFYLFGVWGCAFLTAVSLFFYGYLLSESNWGGIICLLGFFFNHSEATRVMWTPPLRESFAYPYCLLQMLTVSSILYFRSSCWKMTLSLGVFTTCILVSWQFSQFVLLTQIFCLYLLYVSEIIGIQIILSILFGHIFGFLNAAVLTYGNSMLISSFYFCGLCSVCLLLSVSKILHILPLYARIIVGCLLTLLSTIGIKNFLNIKTDAHIVNILLAKFTGRSDFFTQLYTCSKEFDFLEIETYFKLCETFLLPFTVVIILVFLLYSTWPMRLYICNFSPDFCTQPHILYNILQLGVFAVMSALIMRLKLFFTPHLCIILSLVASRKNIPLFSKKEYHWAFLILLISAMSFKGFSNITDQYSIKGQFSDQSLEELFVWVENNTPVTASFAGPMALMANLLLSTKRPVVNHPHFEDANLRNKTRDIYSIFSRKSPEEVYSILHKHQVEYVVLQDYWCFKMGKKGCSMIELWDNEEPDQKHRSPLCPQLFLGNAAPFQRVFQNEHYAVLHLPSQYVQVRLKQYQL